MCYGKNIKFHRIIELSTSTKRTLTKRKKSYNSNRISNYNRQSTTTEDPRQHPRDFPVLQTFSHLKRIPTTSWNILEHKTTHFGQNPTPADQTRKNSTLQRWPAARPMLAFYKLHIIRDTCAHITHTRKRKAVHLGPPLLYKYAYNAHAELTISFYRTATGTNGSRRFCMSPDVNAEKSRTLHNRDRFVVRLFAMRFV